MIYRSNIRCPDLTPMFKHLESSPMPHSFGHDVPRDWADKREDDPVFGLYKKCGFWTHDEAAILYETASRLRGRWVDIGAHTGWTAAHVAQAGCAVTVVDPLLAAKEFRERFWANVKDPDVLLRLWALRSAEVLAGNSCLAWPIDGFVIDGDHEPGEPQLDAEGSVAHLVEPGVIIFHDFIGKPVREAVQYLIRERFHCRVYWTPHVVALCWKGDFKAPEHLPDPRIMQMRLWERMPDFDFSRCE